MSSIGRNDKCWCGSGLKYKKCHLEHDRSKLQYNLEKEHQAYLNRWMANAQTFASQDCYSWMAGKVLSILPSKIFDIGCGDGTGIKTLLSESHDPELEVISIDENLCCLRKTNQLLKSLGYTVDLIERGEVTYRASGKYSYNYSPIEREPKAQITLIQSDFLCDQYIEPYLKSIGKFDAITAWLIGTHLERHNCTNLSSMNITSSAFYRLAVQNKIYSLSDNILRAGGILQTVDRGEPPKSDLLKQDIINAHKDQASVTSLDVYELDFILYKEPTAKSSVAMQGTPGTSGRIPDLTQIAMMSILARK